MQVSKSEKLINPTKNAALAKNTNIPVTVNDNAVASDKTNPTALTTIDTIVPPTKHETFLHTHLFTSSTGANNMAMNNTKSNTDNTNTKPKKNGAKIVITPVPTNIPNIAPSIILKTTLPKQLLHIYIPPY